MRVLGATLVAAVLMTAGARAQSAGVMDDSGYVEGVAQSAFGNVTSQSFGGEAGITIRPALQVFIEAGHVRDAAPPSIGAGAQAIAGVLADAQPLPVDFSVKQPVTFGAAGLRYLVSIGRPFTPYVLAGGGVAQVKHDVFFSVGGSDVTASLEDYKIVLGTDLSGSATKALLVIGGGVAWPAWQRLVIDFQYRYGRIFTDPGSNLNRAGVGVGFRF